VENVIGAGPQMGGAEYKRKYTRGCIRKVKDRKEIPYK
jgi:hypothetical protein